MKNYISLKLFNIKLTKYFKHVFFAIVWKRSVNQIQKQKELNLDSEIQHNEHVNQNPSNIKRYTTESKIVKQIPFTNKIDPSNFYLILYSSLITFASIGVFIYGYYKPSFKHYFAKNDKDEKVDLGTAFDLLGTGIGFASGGRMAVIFMIDVVLFFMMRDLLTWLGKIPFVGKFFNIFLNEHISLHKICGYLFVIYSFIHTVGHLGGSFVKLADILEPANQ